VSWQSLQTKAEQQILTDDCQQSKLLLSSSSTPKSSSSAHETTTTTTTTTRELNVVSNDLLSVEKDKNDIFKQLNNDNDINNSEMKNSNPKQVMSYIQRQHQNLEQNNQQQRLHNTKSLQVETNNFLLPKNTHQFISPLTNNNHHQKKTTSTSCSEIASNSNNNSTKTNERTKNKNNNRQSDQSSNRTSFGNGLNFDNEDNWQSVRTRNIFLTKI
jgi:hypothetical protein